MKMSYLDKLSVECRHDIQSDSTITKLSDGTQGGICESVLHLESKQIALGLEESHNCFLDLGGSKFDSRSAISQYVDLTFMGHGRRRDQSKYLRLLVRNSI